MRFEHALTLEKNISLLHDALIIAIYKECNEEYFKDVLEVSADLIHVGEENYMVKQLVNEKVVIHNMIDFVEMT